jgi:hypothetical protein
MTPRVVAANPRVREDLGRVAVQRGPLVYCLEQVDQAERASIFDLVLLLGADPGKDFTAQFRPEMLGGIVVLQHKGVAAAKPYSELPLYKAVERPAVEAGNEVELTFIPYYAWANRLPGAMEVWIPYRQAARGSPPEPSAARQGRTP